MKEKKSQRLRPEAAVCLARGKRMRSFFGILLLGTVISAGQVLYQMAPFGVAFFSVAFQGGITYALIPCFSLAALFRGMSISSAMGYGVAMLFFSLIRVYVEEKRLSSYAWAALAGGCNLVAGFLVMVGTSPVWYDAFRLILESVLCAVSALAFAKARAPLAELRSNRRMELSEAIALSASVGIVLLGMSDIWSIGGFHPERALGALFVMIFAYQYGIAAAGVGVAAGFFVGMNGYMLPETVASYGFCALAAGALGRYRKWGVALGFILSNAFFTFLVNGSIEVIIHLSESAVAAAAFLLLPQKMLLQYGGFSATEREENYKAYVRESAAREVERLTASFRLLNERIASVGSRPGARPVEDALLFRRTIMSVCADCGMRRACWRSDSGESAKAMDEMLCTVKEWGVMEEERLPEKFRADCVRPKELCRTFSHLYEIYKIERLYARRSSESRLLMTAQIKEMAASTERVANAIREPAAEDAWRSARLRRALEAAKISADEVQVLRRQDGRLIARMVLSPCGGFGRCEGNVLPIVQKTLGVPMEKTDDSVCGDCYVTFCEPYALSVRTEAAKRRADGSAKSGDRYSVLHLPDGRFAAILCDGTGTGHKAARESREAVHLLEALLAAGASGETALSLLNAAVLSAIGQETFTVCDLFLLDLTGGTGVFLKSGAAAGYVLRGGKVHTVRGGGLPAGSAGDLPPSCTQMKLLPGDRVILCSDGVGDDLEGYEMEAFFEEHAKESGRRFAETLSSLGTGRDDRTALVMDIVPSKERKKEKGSKRETV